MGGDKGKEKGHIIGNRKCWRKRVGRQEKGEVKSKRAEECKKGNGGKGKKYKKGYKGEKKGNREAKKNKGTGNEI